jgi:hypothetical protein
MHRPENCSLASLDTATVHRIGISTAGRSDTAAATQPATTTQILFHMQPKAKNNTLQAYTPDASVAQLLATLPTKP